MNAEVMLASLSETGRSVEVGLFGKMKLKRGLILRQ
jgi:hypothetical protein